jgi:hypothetical protein
LPDVPPELVEAFRRLGLARAESWARSETREGINQLSRAKLLYWLFSNVIHTDNGNDLSVATAVGQYDRDEEKQPGSGVVSHPEAPIYKRMLAAGFTEQDIRVILREAQIKAMMDFVCVLDGCGAPPEEAAPCSFGVFEMDEEGKPLRHVAALHENLNDFDVEVHKRIATSPPRPKPDWLSRLGQLRDRKSGGSEGGPAAS